MALPSLASLPQSGSIVSRWYLGEGSGTRDDAVGSNDLTDNNTVTSASGKFGTDAADFERGNSEYLSITDASQTGLDFTSAFTLSAWVKLETSAGASDSLIMRKFGSNGYSFYINTAGVLGVYIHNGTTDENVEDTYVFETGIWYHVAVVYAQNSRLTLYINGREVDESTTTIPTSLPGNADTFYMGSTAGSSNFFDGLILDATAWSVALTDAEVESLFLAYYTIPATSTFPQNGSIVSRWPLVEEAGIRLDMVSTNDLTDNNTVAFGTGQSTSGSDFISAADFELDNAEYLSKTDNAALSIVGDLSFAAWVKFEDIPASGYRGIFGKYGTSGDQRGYALELGVSSSVQTLQFTVSSTGTSGTTKSVTASFVSGTWAHVAVVYDASAGEVDFYVNGVALGSTQTGLPTSIYDGTSAFVIGAWSSAGADPNDGLIQDAVLWSYELSAPEVLAAYNAYFSSTGFMSLNRGFW